MHFFCDGGHCSKLLKAISAAVLESAKARIMVAIKVFFNIIIKFYHELEFITMSIIRVCENVLGAKSARIQTQVPKPSPPSILASHTTPLERGHL